MDRIPRRVIIFLVFFFAIVVFGSLISWYINRSKGSTQEFSEARLQGAAIAQRIVDLSNQSTSDLAKINQYDRDENVTQALTLTEDVIKRSADIRSSAIELSSELEKMTKDLSDIQSPDARQAALDAISSRLALITRLLNYSNDLGLLLETLKARFEGQETPNHTVSQLVDETNAEVTAINNFNNQARVSMDRFDKLVK